jgi:hypothetical protein
MAGSPVAADGRGIAASRCCPTEAGLLLVQHPCAARVVRQRPALCGRCGPYAGTRPLPGTAYGEAEVTEPADEHFWIRVHTALASRHALLLEESYVRNAVRWHRITPENLDTAAPVSARAPC